MWKLETLAWAAVTDLNLEKQVIVVALRLPNKDKYRIKEIVLSELRLDDLKSENGMSSLFQFMDKHIRRF